MPSPADSPPVRASEAGFSLIEGLIAAALLLFVVIGVLPLFSRAMMNNVRGNDSTRATASAVDGFERLLALPFDSLPMTVPGATTELVATDSFLLKANRWVTGAIPSGDEEQWQRTATIRQYNVDDLLDDGELTTPLPGNHTPSQVHLKVIDLELRNRRLDDDERPRYRVRVVQAF